MPNTFTTNFNLTKPEIGGANDTWGTLINSDLTDIDTQLYRKADKLDQKGVTHTLTFTSGSTNVTTNVTKGFASFAVADKIVIDHSGNAANKGTFYIEGITGDITLDLKLENGSSEPSFATEDIESTVAIVTNIHTLATVTNVDFTTAQKDAIVDGSTAITRSSNDLTFAGNVAVTGALTSGALTSTTVNTGQGANELYDMNQNVLTSSNVSFGTINGMNFHAKDYYNTAVGIGAFNNWSTGDGNTCVGYYAGVFINSGGYNTVVGYDALKACTTTMRNTAIGTEALKSVVAPNGNWNTALGGPAGESITTGAGNICIGYTSGGSSSPSGEITTGNYQICLGNNTITNAYIKVDWTVTSDERDKADIVSMSHGLDVIENINPINFVWDTRTDYWDIPDTADEDGNKNIIKHDSDGSKKQSENLRTGFSAQNVKAALDAVGWKGNSVVNSEDLENLKITHTNIIPFLVNAIKELSAKVKALEAA